MLKCDKCNAPIGLTEDGRISFDSSQYHMDAAKKLSEISALKGHIFRLEDAMKEFVERVDRVDRDEVLSKYTYKKFKGLLEE